MDAVALINVQSEASRSISHTVMALSMCIHDAQLPSRIDNRWRADTIVLRILLDSGDTVKATPL